MKKAIAFIISSLFVGFSVLAIIAVICYPIFLAYQQFSAEIRPYHIAAAMAGAFCIGVLTNYFYVSPLNAAAKFFLNIYSTFYSEFFRQGSRYFAKENKTRPFEKIVEVKLSETVTVLGFLTNTIGSKRIVFMPTSRRLTSGLNLIVESTNVTDVNIESEEFIKFIVTSGAHKIVNL